ncbi:hypothetical protein [Roseomonas sp. BN140053]|uniref:hypothetical protein n=1 Tax=Roseomonas sp. BN140053 TaxID=3391898 RepID=UPI0039EB98BF
MMATDAEVAAHLDLSDRTVRELRKRGVFPALRRGAADLDACRLAYIRHLREQAAGRSADASDVTAARVRLLTATARQREAIVGRLEARLITSDDMEKVVGGMLSAARTRLLAIPSAAAPLVAAPLVATVTDARKVQDVLTNHIHDALSELAEAEVVAAVKRQAVASADREAEKLGAGGAFDDGAALAGPATASGQAQAPQPSA